MTRIELKKQLMRELADELRYSDDRCPDDDPESADYARWCSARDELADELERRGSK